MVSSRTFIRVFRLQMGHKTHLVALTANLHSKVVYRLSFTLVHSGTRRWF